MNTVLRLTDDEALALAVRARRWWPTLLPTFDEFDPAAASAAVSRGARSLFARDLLPVDSDHSWAEPLEQLLAPLLTGKAALGTYLAIGQPTTLASGVMTAHYDGGETGWVFETISPRGIHELRPSSPEFAREATAGLLDAAVRSGAAVTSDSAFLCAIGGGSPVDRLRIVGVHSDDLIAYVVVDGQATAADVSLSDGAAAVAFLMLED